MVGIYGAKQRRLLQPIFVKEAVATWESVIRDTSIEFTKKLKEKTSGDLNLSEELRNLIQQIFIEILIGKPSMIYPKRTN